MSTEINLCNLFTIILLLKLHRITNESFINFICASHDIETKKVK